MLHAPSRTIKLAGIAALAGLMMTVAIVAATRQADPAPVVPVAIGIGDGEGSLARELDRCATLTMPDAGCEAAWAENRRRFFDQAVPEPDAQDAATAPAEKTAP